MNQVVLVCGGRDYDDEAHVSRILDVAHDANPIVLLIHGGARGADSLAKRWAEREGVPAREFIADWTLHGKAAGPMRNQRMLDEGKPHMVIAFPGGRGTADMVERAKRERIPVVTVRSRAAQNIHDGAP